MGTFRSSDVSKYIDCIIEHTDRYPPNRVVKVSNTYITHKGVEQTHFGIMPKAEARKHIGLLVTKGFISKEDAEIHLEAIDLVDYCL